MVEMEKTLHPQIEALLAGVLHSDPSAGPPTVEAVREASLRLGNLLAGPGEPVAKIWDSTAGTSQGSIPLRWYQPTDAQRDSLLVYVHGGGWVTGTFETHDTLCRALALRTGFIVLSVGYSLSPEARHPQAMHEVAFILRQAKQLARWHSLEIRTLVAAGDSAGGHLIASALHHLAESGHPLPDAAVFIYPITDASLAYPSYSHFAEGFGLTTERMRWYWEQYLGNDLHLMGDRLRDPYISPICSPHLHRFPPSLIVTAEFDVLHDEALAFAQRLRENSVTAKHLEVPGHIHGFLRYRKALTDPTCGPDAVMTQIGTFLRQQQPGTTR